MTYAIVQQNRFLFIAQFDPKKYLLENEKFSSPSSLKLESGYFGKFQSFAICLVRLPKSLMLSWRLLRTPGLAPFLASLKVGQLLYWPNLKVVQPLPWPAYKSPDSSTGQPKKN
jgi:hypothetical protein